jgi:hypothetical protein
MSASENNLTLVVNQQDSNGVNIVNRTIGAISYAGIVGEFHDGLLTGTGSVTLDLPTANVLQFFFHNTHATAVITLTGTVQGGSSQTIAKIQPGGCFANWCQSTSATAGYTALSVQSDTAGATFEMFLGG